MATTNDALSARTLPLGIALRNVLGITVLTWLVLGVGCFGFLTQLIAVRLRHDLLLASFLLDLGFLAGVLILIGVVVGWQRAHGETLRDIGWGRPTRLVAIGLGIVFGVLWVLTSYARGGNPLGLSWERPVMALIGLVLAFGEELIWRGFFMEQLRRAGVPIWVAIPAAGIIMGSYHGQIGAHYDVLYWASSAVLFTIVGLIYWAGRRSLTPGYVAHAMAHVFGDPVLTIGILQGALALSGISY